jgi:cytochrome c-type protein NapC
MASRISGWIKGLYALLRKPSAKYSLGALLVGGFGAGVIFWGGFNTVVEATNTEKFCISCHEMQDYVYAEYQHSIHYNNRTGVRAVCSDCHVPKEWGPKMVRKVQATRELYGKVVGSINTPEKFEAKRLTLARREWARMMANDSLECRNCHAFEYMDKEKQATRASRAHVGAVADGMTCIQCHQGIAHNLPKDMTDEDFLDEAPGSSD